MTRYQLSSPLIAHAQECVWNHRRLILRQRKIMKFFKTQIYLGSITQSNRSCVSSESSAVACFLLCPGRLIAGGNPISGFLGSSEAAEDDLAGICLIPKTGKITHELLKAMPAEKRINWKGKS